MSFVNFSFVDLLTRSDYNEFKMQIQRKQKYGTVSAIDWKKNNMISTLLQYESIDWLLDKPVVF